MWYLLSNNDGIVEFAKTKREIMLNHNICEREIIIDGKMCYHVYDNFYDYYLFSSKKQAIKAGFAWAFEDTVKCN